MSKFFNVFCRGTIGSLLTGTFVLAATASAQVAVIQGDIKGPEGQPLRGAEVRIERIDIKSAPFTTKTDPKGYYIARGVPVGAYKISLLFQGGRQFSVGDLKVRADDALKVDFNIKTATLTLDSASAKRARHFVWTHTGTGSHTGGRWVEVTQPENPVPKMWNTEEHSGELVRDLERQQKNVRP